MPAAGVMAKLVVSERTGRGGLVSTILLRTGMYFAPLRVFFPVAVLFGAGFLVSLCIDVFARRDLTEATLVLLVASTQLAMFALLADMIDKRSR